jgi:hypothetical protein
MVGRKWWTSLATFDTAPGSHAGGIRSRLSNTVNLTRRRAENPNGAFLRRKGFDGKADASYPGFCQTHHAARAVKRVGLVTRARTTNHNHVKRPGVAIKIGTNP